MGQLYFLVSVVRRKDMAGLTLLAFWRGADPFKTSVANFRHNFKMSIPIGYPQMV